MPDLKFKKDFTSKDLFEKYRGCKDFPQDMFDEFVRTFGWNTKIDLDEFADWCESSLSTEEETLILKTLEKDGFSIHLYRKIKPGNIILSNDKYYVVCLIGEDQYTLVDLLTGEETTGIEHSIKDLISANFDCLIEDIEENKIFTISDFILKKKKGK